MSCLRPRRLPAEWHPQDAVLLAWPHAATDWYPLLEEVKYCYRRLIASIIDHEPVLLVTPDVEDTRRELRDLDNGQIHYFEIDTNDTWARDFGPLTVVDGDGAPLLLDYKFDAWGMKFAACLDNLVVRRLHKMGAFAAPLVGRQGFVLEGGSVESDGDGTLMVTTRCLLSPNRNGDLDRSQIEHQLLDDLGMEKVIWIEHGELAGDDTDAHIDTIARFAPHNTIVFSGTDEPVDAQARSLIALEQELMQVTNRHGQHYQLVKLPTPAPTFDEDGNRMPATYANFLVTNKKVLVPIYGQDTDDVALRLIASCFDREVEGLDCRPLIEQHGSLHCVTMQLPKGAVNFE
ncbi:MAG: agmatine deiminase family protein [Muribaculaceae bacterium]|nr:agmatine deiminase family protein [Muribaculaceae bacterium]